MAFEGLSEKLSNITRKLRGKSRITESDLKEVLREVKLALLEADVNYKIVKDFVATVEQKALRSRCIKVINSRATSCKNCKRRNGRTSSEGKQVKLTLRQTHLQL